MPSNITIDIPVSINIIANPMRYCITAGTVRIESSTGAIHNIKYLGSNNRQKHQMTSVTLRSISSAS